jgi:hypothetical protein
MMQMQPLRRHEIRASSCTIRGRNSGKSRWIVCQTTSKSTSK